MLIFLITINKRNLSIWPKDDYKTGMLIELTGVRL